MATAAAPSSAAAAADPPTTASTAARPRVAVDGAGPPLFQQAVTNVLWRTLSLRMQHSILQLCEAVKRDRVPATFLVQYLELMEEATDDSPRAPHLDRLGFGALAVICNNLQVPLPTQL